MLSVFCKKLAAVETQLEQHTKIIGDLQVMLDVDDETGQRKLKVDNGWVSLRRLMADVQAQVSRMDTRLDELGSQLDQNDAAICDLRSRLAWCRGTDEANGGGGKEGGIGGEGREGIRDVGHNLLLQGGDDGNQDDVAAALLSIPRMTATAQALDWIRAQATAGSGAGPGSGPPVASGGSTHAGEIEETCRNISSQRDKISQSATTGSFHHAHYYPNQSHDPTISNQCAPNAQLIRSACQSYADSVRSRPIATETVREDTPCGNKTMHSNSCRDQETTDAGRPDEAATFCSGKGKERMKLLQEEIQKRDTIIQDLMANHEQLTRKEKEIAKKEEWYEHKMRLLKQDKRKRGETIGKLLRCIDDMRETGGTSDDTHDYTASDDRGLDPGTVGIGRGMRLEARGGGGGGAWVEDDFRDAFQELQDEHRVRLREKGSMETCRPNDHGLGLDDDKSRLGFGSDDDRSRFDLRFEEDRSRLGFDHQQKPTDFAVRHFPLLLTRSTGRELFPPLGQDTNSRNRMEVSAADQLTFSQ